jgi:hypothetical protein
MRAPAPIFVLRLRSVRGEDIHHLRALLKVLLRWHGWRCVSLEQETAPGHEALP